MRRAVLVSLCTLAASCSLVDGYPSPRAEICTGGMDEDLDGLIDARDPDCDALYAEDDYAECHDGRNDDSDGLVDCADPSCAAVCTESDAARCSDGLDEDADGLVDCVDPSCDGVCPEDDPASCADGRDNDGDGLVDTEDQRCWPYATFDVTRCSSVPGESYAATFDVDTDPWTFTEPAEALAIPESDPTGRFGAVVAIPVVPGAMHAAHVDCGRELTGAVDGMTITVPVYADVSNDDVILRLDPFRVSDSGQPWFEIRFGRSYAFYWRLGDADAGGTTLTLPAGGAWYDVHVSVTHGTVLISLNAPDGRVLASGTTAAPAMWDPYLAYRMEVRARTLGSAPADVLVGGATVERPGADPCGIPVPEPAAERPADEYLESVARDGDRLCGVGVTSRTPASYAFSSVDGGDSWTDVAPTGLVDASGSGPDTTFLPMAFDAARGSFRGLGFLIAADRRATMSFVVVETHDCASFVMRPTTSFDGLTAVPGVVSPIGYAIGPYGDGEDVVHEAVFLGQAGGTPALTRALSPDGEPDTWAPTTDLISTERCVGTSVVSHATHAGSELVLVVRDANGLGLCVRDRSGMRRVPTFVFAGSGIAGTFDEGGVWAGQLTFDAPHVPGTDWTGTVTYSAGTDPYVRAIGAARFRVHAR